MCAHCSEVLLPAAPPVRFLRIVETVEGFRLHRFDERGGFVGDLRFETMDDAMPHVYEEYEEVSSWRLCPDDGAPSA